VRIDGSDPVGRDEQGSVNNPVTDRHGEKRIPGTGRQCGELPDTSQKDGSMPGVPENAVHDENEELKWARKHIPEEPAAPHEPARARNRPGNLNWKEEPRRPGTVPAHETREGQGPASVPGC